jgi:hypothetical protein
MIVDELQDLNSVILVSSKQIGLVWLAEFVKCQFFLVP